jgi:sulfite oxidase
MLEQGLAGGELHLLDQSKIHEDETDVPSWEKKKAIADKLFDDKLAIDELPGWSG